MKNRKRVVVSFLLVASMLLGIGYALVTDVLEINGSTTVNQSAAEDAFDNDVYFSDAVANPAPGQLTTTNTASIEDGNNDSALFTVNTLQGAGDSATFTFTITNSGDLDALVTPSLAAQGNSTPEYFSITSDWAGQPRTIAAGGSDTYTVTVTLLKTPTSTVHGSFHILLTATAGTTDAPADSTESTESTESTDSTETTEPVAP